MANNFREMQKEIHNQKDKLEKQNNRKFENVSEKMKKDKTYIQALHTHT